MIPARVAALVRARAAGRCEYCHAPQLLVGQAFHIDHVIPLAAGGQTTDSNLCLSCAHCNLAKAHRRHGHRSAQRATSPLVQSAHGPLGNPFPLERGLAQGDRANSHGPRDSSGAGDERRGASEGPAVLARARFVAVSPEAGRLRGFLGMTLRLGGDQQRTSARAPCACA